jgi:hypothetical protein
MKAVVVQLVMVVSLKGNATRVETWLGAAELRSRPVNVSRGGKRQWVGVRVQWKWQVLGDLELRIDAGPH